MTERNDLTKLGIKLYKSIYMHVGTWYTSWIVYIFIDCIIYYDMESIHAKQGVAKYFLLHKFTATSSYVLGPLPLRLFHFALLSNSF